MRHLRTIVLALTTLASCKGCRASWSPPGGEDQPSHGAPDAAKLVPVPSTSAAVPVDAASPSDAAPPADASAFVDEPFGDAGTSDCRLVYGPAEQPFRGPAALSVVGQELRLVTNDAGRPRVFSAPAGPLPPKGTPSVVPPRPASFVGVRWPACELAGRFAYCQGPGGAILRSVVGGTEAGKKIATARSGTRIAAASLGGDHVAVGFLDLRHTTEGEMLQAFVALDEQNPVRLSDEGAGATSLRFLPRGERAVAVYLDTRTSMVPLHARPVSLEGSELALGTDVVLFVGGVPERGVDFAVGSAGTKGFALVPLPRETIDFGMAAVPIEEPPKEDVPAVWSAYPNGLDPAPISAIAARDGKTAWVARMRPREKAVGSPRILELGRVDASGAFRSYGEIAPGPKNKLSVTDISLIEDGAGAVWILYGDTTVTWLERRVCP